MIYLGQTVYKGLTSSTDLATIAGLRTELRWTIYVEGLLAMKLIASARTNQWLADRWNCYCRELEPLLLEPINDE